MFFFVSRKKRKGPSQRAAAIARGKLLRSVTGAVDNPLIREALGRVVGGRHFEETLQRGASSEAQRQRQKNIAADSKKALTELFNLKRPNSKIPPTTALRELKNFFLTQLIDPQGEIKSFDAMRQYLKQRGICVNEGNFNTVFNHMFSKRERELLEKAFNEKLNKPDVMRIWLLTQPRSQPDQQ